LHAGICVAWTASFIVFHAYFSDPQLQLLSQQAIMQTILLIDELATSGISS
jgi:hypothetical protein